MSQYQQSFVFAIDRFPAIMKLQDLHVHLRKTKANSAGHYVSYNPKHECVFYIWRQGFKLCGRSRGDLVSESLCCSE